MYNTTLTKCNVCTSYSRIAHSRVSPKRVTFPSASTGQAGKRPAKSREVGGPVDHMATAGIWIRPSGNTESKPGQSEPSTAFLRCTVVIWLLSKQEMNGVDDEKDEDWVYPALVLHTQSRTLSEALECAFGVEIGACFQLEHCG